MAKKQDEKNDAAVNEVKDETAENSGVLEREGSEDADVQVEDCPQTQIAELTDRLQRTMADFDNFRKRTEKERGDMRDYGVRLTIEKLLPVLDNFERAMSASQHSDDSFTVGMQMILKQFSGAFDELGVREIPALDEDFNPDVHFAVSHIDDKRYEDNKVIEILQKGYKYKDKIIRPSMVRVAN
ncbi:MAG: nucleotide exchange factor GrpE [Defluviitaleaceae bacterium]|nr:nucleotide exchange factor GrpE [Defluviitaleaceae bacterium]